MMFGNGKNTPGKKSWSNESDNWLKSRFHFSFAEYHNPRNSKFGVLRVMNDDFVQPDRGFGTHGHSNMEIVTYVVDGELSHADSNGNEEALGRGSVQFMSAGRGVRHSEFNNSPDSPLRFIQMWVTPREMNIPSNYGSLKGDYKARCNKWQHLVSDRNSTFNTPIKIVQDANFYVAELDAGVSVKLGLASGRQAYALCIEGAIEIGTTGKDSSEEAELERHAAAELFGKAEITFTATSKGAHILVVEMNHDGSSRFKR